ncbi:hypothetical protein CHISP_1546 [Chitinispirillum alkaliphilum]|nr:hypothetical protein CHISP_1546 [Chitinispirillum alkaliphilum]
MASVNAKVLKNGRLSLIFLTIIGISAGLGVLAYRNAGNWLLIQNPLPPDADLVFVFGGDVKRVEYAFGLMENYPDAILVCAERDFDHLKRRYPERVGDYRIKIADKCESTIEEVRFLRSLLAEENRPYMSVLLVSSPFHMRRISVMVNMVMGRALRRDIQFLYTPYDSEENSVRIESYSKWWETESTKGIVQSELLKLTYYFLVVVNPLMDENRIRERFLD